MKLRVATYNIHKGMSAGARRLTIAAIREQLAPLNLDILCLQEVQGAHDHHPARFAEYPTEPHHDYLAKALGHGAIYGMNAVYDHGHHGNAVLSHLPVIRHSNLDISHHRMESRGMLHVVLHTGIESQPRLNVVCVHLGLFAVSRRFQLKTVVQALASRVPANEPLIIAGDFNDWQRQAHVILETELKVIETHVAQHARPALTFPSRLPVMALDRIYVRGCKVHSAQVLSGAKWARLSDHALLMSEIELL
jgi:endonuclease/exonuclease/phosphatase family metal-dependent hydrolase